MGYPSFGPEPVVAFRILLYCTAYIFGGAALIGLSLYVALLSAEMFSHLKGGSGAGDCSCTWRKFR